jgi:hypothetical protein
MEDQGFSAKVPLAAKNWLISINYHQAGATSSQ